MKSKHFLFQHDNKRNKFSKYPILAFTRHCDSLKFAIINMPVAFQASTNHSKVDMQLTKFLPSLISEYDPMTDPPKNKHEWFIM